MQTIHSVLYLAQGMAMRVRRPHAVVEAGLPTETPAPWFIDERLFPVRTHKRSAAAAALPRPER